MIRNNIWRRSSAIGGIVLVFLTVTNVATPGAPPSTGRDLVKQSTDTGVTVTSDSDDTEAYYWTSSGQLLFLSPAPGHKHFQGVSVNLASGSRIPLTAFNKSASSNMPVVETMTVSYATSTDVKHVVGPPLAALSPDANWLLWRPANASTRVTWYAASLDGARHMQWKTDVGADCAFWLPDGHRWMVPSRDQSSGAYSRARIYSFSDSKTIQTVRWTGVGDGVVLGITKSNTVLVNYPNRSLPAKQRYVRMAEVGITQRVEHAVKFTVRLANPAEVATVLFSPDGATLAFLLTDGIPYSTHGQVWLSDTRGRNMHLLGRMEGESAWGRGLHWLPDGKHLSFFDHNSICTVAIP